VTVKKTGPSWPASRIAPAASNDTDTTSNAEHAEIAEKPSSAVSALIVLLK
jgi:hypothetical protein